jgi:hypothetical protein
VQVSGGHQIADIAAGGKRLLFMLECAFLAFQFFRKFPDAVLLRYKLSASVRSGSSQLLKILA